MNHYMIACHLKSDSVYSNFKNAIEALDFSFEHPISNIWYIQSDHTIDNIQQHLLSLIELDDVLIISDILDKRAYNAANNNIQNKMPKIAPKISRYNLFA